LFNDQLEKSKSRSCVLLESCDGTNVNPTYPTDDIFVIGKMGFAVLAAVDLVAIKIGVIRKTHGDGRVRGHW
jgi:hypothetical protein